MKIGHTYDISILFCLIQVNTLKKNTLHLKTTIVITFDHEENSNF